MLILAPNTLLTSPTANSRAAQLNSSLEIYLEKIIGYFPSQPPSPSPYGHVYSSLSQQSTF